MIEPETGLGLEAAGFGLHLDDGDRRRVVDIDRRFREASRGGGQFRPVRFPEESLAETLRVHAGLRGQHARRQLFLGHFQRENRDGNAHLQGGILGDVQGKGGLAHARPAGDDDQIGVLEPRGDVVDLVETGRHPCDQFLFGIEPLDRFEAVLDDVPDRVERGTDLVFGDLEDGMFRLVQDAVDVHAGIVALVEDLGGRADETAQDALFLDDLGVIGDVDRRGDIVHQRGEIGRSPDLFHPFLILEDVAQGDQVARLVPVGKLDDGGKDLPVGLAVEVGRLQQLQNRVQGQIVQQDAAQNGLLRFEVLGRHLMQGGIDILHGRCSRKKAVMRSLCNDFSGFGHDGRP